MPGKGSFWRLSTGSPDEVPKSASHVSHSLPKDLHFVFSSMHPRPSNKGDNKTPANLLPKPRLQDLRPMYWQQPQYFSVNSGAALPQEMSFDTMCYGFPGSLYHPHYSQRSFNISPACKPQTLFNSNAQEEYQMHLDDKTFSGRSEDYPDSQTAWPAISRIHEKNLQHHRQHDLPIGDATLVSPYSPPLTEAPVTPVLREASVTKPDTPLAFKQSLFQSVSGEHEDENHLSSSDEKSKLLPLQSHKVSIKSE